LVKKEVAENKVINIKDILQGEKEQRSSRDIACS